MSNLELLVWDRAAPRSYQRIEAHADGAEVSAAADGDLVVSAGGDATVKMWKASTGKLLATHQVGQKHVNVVAVTPDGALVAVGDRSGKITLLRPAAPDERLEFQWDIPRIKSLALSADGKLLASGGTTVEQDNLTLWRTDSSELPRALPGHPQILRNGAQQPVFAHATSRSEVLALAFSPDGQVLASGAGDFRVRLWDVPTGRLLHELVEHQGWVRDVAFSPNGKLLASASQDGTIKLWDTQEGTCAAVLNAYFAAANSVAFAPDGKTLASGHDDKTVRLWNVATRELCTTFKEPAAGVTSIAFAAGGKVLVAGDSDGGLHFWRTAVAEK